MTIQLALMNAHGIAMASTRPVQPGERTGRDAMVQALRGQVPAAVMFSGASCLFGVPMERFALRFERALAGAASAGAEGLARAALDVLDGPVADPAPREDEQNANDLAVVRDTLEYVGRYAAALGDGPEAAMRRVIGEMREAKPYRDGDALMADARETWTLLREQVPAKLQGEWIRAALEAVPDLCGKSVVGALSRAWRTDADAALAIGICCPETSIPAIAAVRLWRGLGNRLTWDPQLRPDGFALSPLAQRTTAVPQGAGADVMEAMIAGIGDEAWEAAGSDASARLQIVSDGRWERAHRALATSGLRGLCSAATGLIRGAEALGFLCGEDGADPPRHGGVDCVLVTPRGAAPFRAGDANPDGEPV